jgi:hypothetical protein
LIKMMILAPRRVGMTHVEFRRYVTETHGPLVKSVTAVAQDIRHYHYNFPILEATDTAFGHPLADHLDIVTEAWFDSVQAQKDNMRRPGYMEIVRPDEHRFADGERAVLHYTREIPVIDGERTTFRAFYLRRRSASGGGGQGRDAVTRGKFQEYWLDGVRRGLKQYDRLPAGVTAYVQNHTVNEADHPDGDDPKYFDLIDQFFLKNQGALSLLAGSGLATIMTALEDSLVDTTRTRAFMAETVLNIP